MREEKSFYHQTNITLQKKTKTNVFLSRRRSWPNFQKLRSRIAAPNGAVTGTGQPRPCNLTCNGACCVGPSGSVQEKVCPSTETRRWTKISAVLLAIAVNVLVPKSVDRDRSIETRVQSDSASGTAHAHMKNLKLISCRVFTNVCSC